MSAKSLLDAELRATETQSSLGAGGASTSSLEHYLRHRYGRRDGTGDGQQDVVWSDRLSVAVAGTTLNLNNGLTSKLNGAALTITELVTLFIVNQGSVTLQITPDSGNELPVFGAGSELTVGAGGCLLLDYPSGLAITSSTQGLVLQAASGTIDADIAVLGRSS